ncbi:N-acetylglucosamine-6-phosphate deacetylase [Paenarthrobacter ilicis]|uniref:N-acetylglucosamine-6-phosphate deacetylase n=1 Tax=Paenarthrobacter ilicis TaxID=43665 RepID=A0ABX0TF79_9MICC|nr:amidohydrolase family protein [Paenarthrobacter ilicis]MBM7793665.1 N-acetylglucosamine-6-phosphate deacetylase [Paenarthrobacter ilicis]NII99844.1 N-acetylglucosamine-6-phosphate deacetylase [Paenarthrobacter ilicis]
MTAADRYSGPSAPSHQIIKGTLVSDGQVVEDGLLALEGDRIAYAGPAQGFDTDAHEGFGGAVRLGVPSGSFLLPGLVDVHCHGGNGGDFPGGDEDSARKAADFLHRSGTTTFLASMVTAPREDLLRGIKTFVKLVDEGLVAGIHLEGPFLSHARCGAQNPAYLLEPDLDLMAELVGAADGKLTTMTYAPELPGAGALVDLMTSHGVTPSLGHTDCDDATAAMSLAAARDGLELAGFDGVSSLPTVTHLFNGMPPLHHRAPGPVAACLRMAQEGKAVVELIADGTHLDPSTVATVFQLVGAANILLVTDSMAAAGLSDGSYMLGPSPVTVRDGVATLDATGSIAGGTATLLDVVRKTVDAGVSLTDAVHSATAVPAAVLGLSDEIGGLRRGLRADVIVTDQDLELTGVLRNGQWLHG